MTEKQTQAKPNPGTGDEIDLLELAKTIWKGRKTLIFCLIAGTILGVFIAIATPKEYTATTIMVPQMSSGQSKMGGLGGLAALAGIDISATQGSELSPIIFPKIVNSIPFKLELMNTPVKFTEFSKPVSLFDYYTKYNKPSILGTVKKYTIGLPGVILKAIKGKPKELNFPVDSTNQPLMLSENQYAVKKVLDNMISLEANAKEGYLTLTVQMPEALAAAQVAQKAQELLQREIIKFKVDKAKAELDFIQERYNIAKAQAEGYQVNIAQKTDQYKKLTSNVPQVQTARIQTQYGIANTVYIELAKQLEQAKIQVKKDTPVFTIVEPVSVPSEKSKPNRPMILFIWIFLGGIVGVGIIFSKHYLAGIRQKWNED